MAESVSWTLSNSLNRSFSFVQSIRQFLWADAADSGDERSPGDRLKFTAPGVQPSFFCEEPIAPEAATLRQRRPDAAAEGAAAPVIEVGGSHEADAASPVFSHSVVCSTSRDGQCQLTVEIQPSVLCVDPDRQAAGPAQQFEKSEQLALEINLTA